MSQGFKPNSTTSLFATAASKQPEFPPALLQKPTRPLTSYHLFFQLQREYIIQTTPKQQPHSSSDDDDDNNNMESESKDRRPLGKDIDNEMPRRYRHIRLSPQWFMSASGKRVKGASSSPSSSISEEKKGQHMKKRKHRKTHGIGFLTLSKMISLQWSEIEETDIEIKHYVRKIADRELKIYKRDMEHYKSNLAINFQLKNRSLPSINLDTSLASSSSSNPPSLSTAQNNFLPSPPSSSPSPSDPSKKSWSPQNTQPKAPQLISLPLATVNDASLVAPSNLKRPMSELKIRKMASDDDIPGNNDHNKHSSPVSSIPNIINKSSSSNNDSNVVDQEQSWSPIPLSQLLQNDIDSFLSCIDNDNYELISKRGVKRRNTNNDNEHGTSARNSTNDDDGRSGTEFVGTEDCLASYEENRAWTQDDAMELLKALSD